MHAVDGSRPTTRSDFSSRESPLSSASPETPLISMANFSIRDHKRVARLVVASSEPSVSSNSLTDKGTIQRLLCKMLGKKALTICIRTFENNQLVYDNAQDLSYSHSDMFRLDESSSWTSSCESSDDWKTERARRFEYTV